MSRKHMDAEGKQGAQSQRAAQSARLPPTVASNRVQAGRNVRVFREGHCRNQPPRGVLGRPLHQTGPSIQARLGTRQTASMEWLAAYSKKCHLHFSKRGHQVPSCSIRKAVAVACLSTGRAMATPLSVSGMSVVSGKGAASTRLPPRAGSGGRSATPLSALGLAVTGGGGSLTVGAGAVPVGRGARPGASTLGGTSAPGPASSTPYSRSMSSSSARSTGSGGSSGSGGGGGGPPPVPFPAVASARSTASGGSASGSSRILLSEGGTGTQGWRHSRGR
jgi:hypothetical protein